MMKDDCTLNRKAMASLSLLVIWEIWNECNTWVFHNKHALPLVILDKIKRETLLWVIVSAKHWKYAIERIIKFYYS
jgi:hypothetical protein